MVQTSRFAPNEFILRENDPGESAFLIESGRVEVFTESLGKRIHIAFLGKGATFGEMSMVDDLNRSANVMAVEETVVRVFRRDELYAAMVENPEVFGKFMKSIFERLREANTLLATTKTEAIPSARLANLKDPSSKTDIFSLEGDTPEARAAMPSNPFVIKSFPFKIGRKSDDPFLYNHFEVEDRDPAQISRHHVTILFEGGRIGVLDVGSEHGTQVNGTRIGGKKGPGPVFFEGKEGDLVLGSESSPYRFRIRASQ